jgi:hypothetical protein
MAETAVGEWFDLDRAPPFAPLLARLARFRGAMVHMEPLTRRTGPVFGRLLLGAIRCAAPLIRLNRPLLVCPGRDSSTHPVLLVLAEWLEFRQAAPADGWSLLIHTAPDYTRNTGVALITELWEHVQTLKRQFGIHQARVFLQVSDAARYEEAQCMPLADALLVTHLDAKSSALLHHAVPGSRPVVCPDVVAEQYSTMGGFYGYATRQTVLKRSDSNKNDAAGAYQVPEPFAIANAIRRLVNDWADGAAYKPQLTRGGENRDESATARRAFTWRQNGGPRPNRRKSVST